MSREPHPVGLNKPHDSALAHVTGTSVYIDDRRKLQDEIMVGYVGSPLAAGRLRGVDASGALAIPGVLCVLTHRDLHHNRWGTIFQDQPLLVEDRIGYHDEPICVIAAETTEALNLAKRAVQFDIQPEAGILSLETSIAQRQFLYEARPFAKGNVDEALAKSENILKGIFRCGGQEHFYLESQASIVYPLEDNQLEVHSSSQHPTETQHVVAEACGLRFHDVVCVVKRMGGGFGGKESQAAPFAAYAAVVAQKLKRPARIVLSKDEDMQVTGKRHPFQIFYEVGFDDSGRIQALRADLYADGGAYCDLSSSILERAMFHSDGAYYLPAARISGWVCRTNTHSNTAFRGFGAPQGNMMIESVIADIAQYLKKDSYKVRQINCYGANDRNVTPYGQTVVNNPLPDIFARLYESSDYLQRCQQIEEFNQKNKFKVRGISLSAVKFGVAFTARHLNQGSALVNWHLDGTVQVSTGATEMGQGVNTKIQQVVAAALGIDVGDVRLMPTSTEKNHNSSPTAASSGSDINASAALNACNVLKLRLISIARYLMQTSADERAKQFQDWKLEVSTDQDLHDYAFANYKITQLSTGHETSIHEVLQAAYMNRISLGEYAHYRTPNLGFDKSTGQGQAFGYYTNGAAVSEVEVDCDTGETKVLRVDVLMDLGRMINPGIDRGQVTGGFVQGMGWVTTESLYHNSEGVLLSHSPTTYKIPNVQDTPRIFNVDFIENSSNVGNVHRSKAVGEPPLLAAASVWLAIKDAIFRKTKTAVANLKSPATNEEILLTLNRLSEQSKLESSTR